MHQLVSLAKKKICILHSSGGDVAKYSLTRVSFV
jgi:hypothetical protein